MRLESRDEKPITSVDAWGRVAAPAAARHWKPGRSAYELARAWIEDDAADRVVGLLSAAGLDDPALVSAIAEKKTRFDQDPRGPRNHDLLVHATTSAGPVVVGVEGKADETFDKTLIDWRAARLKSSAASGGPARVDNLTTLFFDTTLDEDSGTPPLASLGYQLLSALAGTLADAKAAEAAHAVLLVHEFVTDCTDDAKHAHNARALEDFLVRLFDRSPARVAVPGGWITEPTTIRGDGTWMPLKTPVCFAKLGTERRGAARRR